MKRKSTFAVASLILLSLFIIAPHAFAKEVTAPNPAVEAAAAKALLGAETQLKIMSHDDSPKTPSLEMMNDNFWMLAMSLARLGRTESALQATNWMTIDGDVTNGKSFTRSEILRLSVRRSALLNNVPHAENLAAQMKNPNAKADALLTLARAYLRKFDYPAAQKVLFQVTPLVPKNFDALLYTAYLFSQSGNIAVSKRLFERAEKMLTPWPKATQAKGDDVGTRTFHEYSRYGSLEDYLFKAGLIDEWQRFRKKAPRTHLFLDATTMDRLLQLNQIDLAIEVARDTFPKNFPAEKAGALVGIALQIAPKYPDKALSLLDEASADLDALSQPLKGANGDTAVFLATGYHSLGKEAKAQEWLQRGVKDVTPHIAAQWKLEYLLFPLFISTNVEKKSTFPPDQLLQINNEVQSLLPSLGNDDTTQNFLRQLIAAQIKVGQINEARDNIEFLDKIAKQQIVSGKPNTSTFGNIVSLSDVLSVAEFWKKTGDQKRCDALLQAVLNAPQKVLTFSKTERINAIMLRGFVDEGLSLFSSLPVAKQKSPASLLPDLPYAMARAHPDQFPDAMLRQLTPVAKCSFLSGFVLGLTSDIFRAPQDGAFVLHTNSGLGMGE